MRRAIQLAVVAAATLVIAACPLVAQSGNARLTADSILTELGATDSTGVLPNPARCLPGGRSLQRLCKALVDIKRSEGSGGVDAAIAAELSLHDVVFDEPRWALGWYALGQARLAMARHGARAKEGPLQILGVSLEAGAGNALARAVELEPDLTIAAEALALVPIPREGSAQLGPRLAALRTTRHLLSPLGLLGLAKVERSAGSRDSSAAAFNAALATGAVDSGVIQLELAREYYAVRRAEEGREALINGATHDTEAARDAYRRELEWVATPAEMADWDSTAAADRSAWLRRFWSSRDVEAGWPDGARLVEHYARVEHAWKYFTLALPPSGRHKLVSRTPGVDNYIDYLQSSAMMGRQGGIVDTGGGGFTDESQARLVLDQLQAGSSGPFRPSRQVQEVMDDRGVVWIRYGEPDRSKRAVGGEALEVWAYDNVVPPFVLQFREEDFDGQVGASTLVPTLLDVPARYRDQFCGMVQSLCSLTAVDPMTPDLVRSRTTPAQRMTDNGRINQAVIEREVRSGKANIERAVSTDAMPREFSKAITPVVRFYGLGKPAGGTPVVLAGFAIPAVQLSHHSPPEAGGRTVYSVRLMLSTVGPSGEYRRLDTLRHFAVAAPLQKGQFLNGLVELGAEGGASSASLAVTQEGGAGGVAARRSLNVPTVSRGRLQISSLVTGREGGIAWRGAGQPVPVNALGSFAEGGEAEVYYQLSGLVPGDEYVTKVEVYPSLDRDARAAISVSFTERAGAANADVTRTLGLRDLDRGEYRLSVTVSGGGASVTATETMAIVK